MTFNLDTFYQYKGYDSFADGITGVDTFYVSMDLGTTGPPDRQVHGAG